MSIQFSKRLNETKISNGVLYWLFILGHPPQQVSYRRIGFALSFFIQYNKSPQLSRLTPYIILLIFYPILVFYLI